MNFATVFEDEEWNIIPNIVVSSFVFYPPSEG